ncbi:BTAD domain-containing putative transcriptional regulator [Streptomyces cupreus]|uniref:Transcriptional regulator n=1 Tax=Streptomyces cupreus TaxID=2759956 RepID=A0A7X1IYY9_9ACTN|nr:BTAD domain-containing putative transcriptional regulator [Streptomyces cupreus]MBC2900529.1 transcriptional regulator [Streptomyces cupreus]
MFELRIRLLGGFRADVGRREIADGEWRLRKAKSLVKLLALAPGHRLHREQVMDVLWPELSPEAGDNQLRKVLHEARRTLDPDPAATYRYLESGERLGLCRAVTWVDVEAFEDAALQARRAGDPAEYRRAIALYGGDLLPEDRYAEWAIERAEALRAEYLALLVELGRLLEARVDFDSAAAVLRTAVGIDPPYEDAAVALMRVYALAGRRHEALGEYRRLRAAMERESAAGPGPAAERLHEQIRTGQVFQPELTGDLWGQVGDLRMLSGDAAGAAAAYTCALDAAGRGPRDLTGVALHRKAATAYLQQHDSEAAGLHLRVAEEWRGAAHEDRAEAGRVRGVRANWLWEVGRYAEAQQAAEASRHAAERYGTSEDVAAAEEQLAIVHHCRGNWREGLHSEIERLGAGADKDATLARIFDIHCCIGQYHLYGDGLSDSVEEYARRTLDLALSRGARRAEAFAWCLLGESLLLQGRWDEAAGCLERSAQIHDELGGRSSALPRQRLAELAAGRGDSEAVAGQLRRGMAAAAISPLAQHAFGRLYATAAFDAVERGEPAEAVRAARSASAAAARYGECPSCTALLYPVAAEAFAALGDAAGAAEHARAAERVAGLFRSSAWSAMAETASGALAEVRGEPSEARRRHLAAAELYGRARQPYWAARSKVRAALAGPRPTGDQGLLDEAAATFEALGAERPLRAVAVVPQGSGGR